MLNIPSMTTNPKPPSKSTGAPFGHRPTRVEQGRFLSAEEEAMLRRRVMDRADADRAKGRVTGIRMQVVVELALFTGARVAELAALDCGDVDLSRRGLEVLTVLTVKRKAVGLTRTLTLGPRQVMLLKTYLDWKKANGESLKPEAPLLCSQRQDRLTRQGWQKTWDAAVVLAGMIRRGPKNPKRKVARFSIHDARHTVGMRLYRQTKNLRLVQKWLGHANPQTTAKYYADVTLEDMREAVKNI